MKELGVCQWFHYEDARSLERALRLLDELGLRRLRTGISWADWHRPRGEAWYDRQMRALADAGLELLVSIWHTPPSIAAGGTCASPPRRLADYGDFVAQVLDRYGEHVAALELWNEPNNLYKWDFAEHDPDWSKFAAMALEGARAARRAGVPTVLGGIIPADPSWLRLVERHGLLEEIDVVAFHSFPGMWWDDQPCWDRCEGWHGWRARAALLRPRSGSRPLWVTETGLATWDLERGREAKLEQQVLRLEEATRAPVERVYWYSLVDLDPTRPAIEGFHVDENEYHMGLVRWDGSRKPAFERLRELVAEDVAVARGSR